MSKHTKGPWKSRHDEYATWVGDQRWISVTATKRGEIGRFKRDSDAVLAASAPELLEALQQAVTSMQDSGYPNDSLVIRAARQAITKATA